MEDKKEKLSDPLSQVIKCKRCNTKFDSMAKIQHYDGHTGTSICPKCGYGVKVVKNVQAKGYMRSATGQLVSVNPRKRNRKLPVQIQCQPKLTRKQKRALRAISN